MYRQKSPSSVPSRLRGKRVLVVDDWPEVTSLISEILSQSGAQVEAVTDGYQAIQLLSAQPYDLLILDLGMPHPDGWEILDFMRQDAPEALDHTIVLTGRRYDPQTRQRLAAEELAVLYKPFSLEALLDLAVRALGRRPAA
ncbi:MAG: response regulator [Planctomycetaceae bacterium]|nr:response regulator [Planctomycetaceae bacterium]